MPGRQQKNSYRRSKSLKDLRGRMPHLNETIECPVTCKTFDRFAIIEPASGDGDGEIEYYCPYCDTLVLRELRGRDRDRFEVIDREHQAGAK